MKINIVGFLMLEIKAVLHEIPAVVTLAMLTWYFEINSHCCKYERYFQN